MESTFVFWLFLTFFVGAGMLILVLGYRSIEEQRLRDEQREAERRGLSQDLDALPSFFLVNARKGPSANGPVLDDAMIAALQSHVRSEQALASKFVQEPSVDSLYRQPASSTFVN